MTPLELTLALSLGLIGAVALVGCDFAIIHYRSRARKIASVLAGTSPDPARDAAYLARIEHGVGRDFEPAELPVLACCRAAKEIR